MNGDTKTHGEETPLGVMSRFSRIADRVAAWPCRVAPPGFRGMLEAGIDEGSEIYGLSSDYLVGIRMWSTVLLPVTVLLLLRLSPVGILLVPPSAALGYCLPMILSSLKKARFAEEIRQAVPGMSDMLYALILGGKNLDQAFRVAVESSAEPLRSLLSRSVRQIDLGMPREESFNKLAENLRVPELSSLLQLLLEAEKRGFMLSGTLEVYSREIRAMRRDQLRTAAAKAPLKLLAPLVFLILPASVILTIGPTFLATLRNAF